MLFTNNKQLPYICTFTQKYVFLHPICPTSGEQPCVMAN